VFIMTRRHPLLSPRRGIALLAAALGCVITVGGARQIHADGGVVDGVTTLLLSGDTATKIDLVFLGDGFTRDQQADYNAKVDEAVTAFLGAHPIKALRSAFNIHRVNVISPESGTDKFATCGTSTDTGDSDVSRRTAMDSGYCNGGTGSVYRCMGTSNPALAQGFAANAPDDDVVIVLVNDSGYGGCAFGSQTFLTLTSRFAPIVVHELGHAMFNLADEYRYDSDDTFTGTEPQRVDITIATSRENLKWGDLVLPGTAVPTQNQAPNCGKDADLPDRSVDADLVGTFEGANHNRCGIFRPQYDCRMRENDLEFCSVCRRKIIRDLVTKLNDDRAVFFANLLIRDDEDPWPRGNGEIYLHYDLHSGGQTLSGRWPAEGESSFDDGDAKDINFFAGVMPQPLPGEPSSIDLRVRESDWPDGDDDLSSDATEPLPASGAFSVDRDDYRLNGNVESADLRVLLDVLNVKDDQDGFFTGDGDIYVEYTVSNGSQSVTGRWPASDTHSMGDHDTAYMNVLAASLPAPPADGTLSIHLRVFDEDGFLADGDDQIGDDTFTFSSADDFGATATTHVRDLSGYRITFSIAKRPPPVIGRLRTNQAGLELASAPIRGSLDVTRAAPAIVRAGPRPESHRALARMQTALP
jgi:IgA Peptidase M64.